MSKPYSYRLKSVSPEDPVHKCILTHLCVRPTSASACSNSHLSVYNTFTILCGLWHDHVWVWKMIGSVYEA